MIINDSSDVYEYDDNLCSEYLDLLFYFHLHYNIQHKCHLITIEFCLNSTRLNTLTYTNTSGNVKVPCESDNYRTVDYVILIFGPEIIAKQRTVVPTTVRTPNGHSPKTQSLIPDEIYPFTAIIKRLSKSEHLFMA